MPIDPTYTELARLRGFLICIRDNVRSGSFARTMATTALEGTATPLDAEKYWQAQTATDHLIDNDEE